MTVGELVTANGVREKSFAFAVRMVNLHRYLTIVKKEFVLSRQLLRSGTAIGALVREADQAESKPDFVHKLAIARKEASETEYWISLLKETKYLSHRESASALADNAEATMANCSLSTIYYPLSPHSASLPLSLERMRRTMLPGVGIRATQYSVNRCFPKTSR